MVQITRPQTIINVNVDRYWSPKKVQLRFVKEFIEVDGAGNLTVLLTRTQTTQLINALKSQRKRKGVQ